MSRSSIIIAIDGYSSTGKSSFARRIAGAYGLLYLDSGALYRTVTLFAMENELIKDGVLDAEGLHALLPKLNVRFSTAADGSWHCFIGGRDVEDRIRTMEVSSNVSYVAADRVVRRFVDDILHFYGKSGGVVMDGRDIGTTVFPQADIKIFMTASPQVRAQRRMLEMEAKGQSCTLGEVLKNLEERDYIDSHREISPLVKADDAMVLDNSDMTLDDQMEWIDGIMKARSNESRN